MLSRPVWHLLSRKSKEKEVAQPNSPIRTLFSVSLLAVVTHYCIAVLKDKTQSQTSGFNDLTVTSLAQWTFHGVEVWSLTSLSSSFLPSRPVRHTLLCVQQQNDERGSFPGGWPASSRQCTDLKTTCISTSTEWREGFFFFFWAQTAPPEHYPSVGCLRKDQKSDRTLYISTSK